MGTNMQGTVVMEPRIDIAAMGAIVRELIGDDGRDRDVRWLRERTTAAGLGTQACAALETVRARLNEGRLTPSFSVWDILSGIDGTW